MGNKQVNPSVNKDSGKNVKRRADHREYLLQQMIDSNPVPFFVIDEDHHVIHWSRGCEEVLGKRANEMIGTSDQWKAFYAAKRPTLADLIVENAIDEINEGPYLDKMIQPSSSIRGAYEAVDYFPGLGREGLWLHFTAAPIRDPQGRIIGAIETLQDVSLQHKADVQLKLTNSRLELEVARRTAELAESNRNLEKSLARSEEINRLKSIFLSAISTELKTPLNGILGFAELIQMDLQDKNIDQYVAEIHASGSTLLGLLNDLLTLSEIAAGQAELPEDQFSPEELVESVLSRYKSAARDKDIELFMTRGGHCPELMIGDGRRLIHCLGCLIDNAVKFTHEGAIHVQIDGRGDFFVITVNDTGPGLSLDAEAMIFERFSRLERFSASAPGGMGLGLALVKAQVEIMNGTLDVISKPGEGSSFTLALPLRPLIRQLRKAQA